MIKWLITLICFISFKAYADLAHMVNLRVVPSGNQTRITIKLDDDVLPKLFMLSNPDRLVMDFPDIRLTPALLKINLKNTGINDIRMGHPKPGLSRLVFDLKARSHFKIISKVPVVVVELTFPTSFSPTYVRAPILPPVAPPLEKVSFQQSVKTVKNSPPPKTTFVVVIDPGHGGKDPGAIGENGTQEKTIVLQIAKALAAIINEQPHFRAVLTRQGDYFVPLRDRLRLARKGDADLFIAIHADSYFINDRSSGASVYALSERGATSEAARWLAKRENYSELGGVDLSELGDQSYLLRSVLIDLAQTATITDSLRLGTSILNALDDVTRLHYKRVEQAPFMVLKSPDIPSVLVETGFLSNSQEEKKLRDPAYQRQLAAALFNGIQRYITKYSMVSQ